MFSLKYSNTEKDDVISAVFSELKILGVKVPKLKKFKNFNLKQEKTAQGGSTCKIFGVSLSEQEWITDGEAFLPKFVAMSTAYLQKYSNKEVGLFRKAGNVARQKKLRAKLENGGNLEDSEPNDVASLLKQWLRELPEPLILPSLQDLFIRCSYLNAEKSHATAYLLVCLLLLPPQLYTFKHLLRFLADIAFDSESNKMNAYNLAVIMAPNIFTVHKTEEKNKGNLVQQFTSIMKTLIENCDKIGEIPPGVTFQYPSLSSELDSSCDILDSNKPKKKRRSGGGHVQDIFSGIKKLVGQNGTPSKHNTPENCLDTPDLSRKVHSTEELNNPASFHTPKAKGLTNNSEKVSHGHVRRKSIGALLRRKRVKSEQLKSEYLQLKQSSNNIVPYAENSTKILETKATQEEPSTSSNKNETAKDVGSIKKSWSDRYLVYSKSDFSVLPKLAQSYSQSCLPIRTLNSSPYNLRSSVLHRPWLGEATFLDDLKKVNKDIQDKNIHRENSTAEKCNVKSKVDTEISAHQNISVDINAHDVTLTDCKNDAFSSRELNEAVLSLKRSDSQISVMKHKPCSKNNIDSQDSSTSNIKKNSKVNNSDSFKAQKSGMVRQEAFIVRNSKRKSRNSNSQIRRSGSSRSELNSKHRSRQQCEANASMKKISETHCIRRNASERRSLRKRTRHGSLIRGRPNSVNSGLRSANVQMPRRKSEDSPLTVNPLFQTTNTCTSVLDAYQSSDLGSPRPQSLDLSLNILLQNFCLNSPSDPSKLSLNIGIKSDENISVVNLNLSHKDPEETQGPTILPEATPEKRKRKRRSCSKTHSDAKSEKYLKVKEPDSCSSDQFQQDANVKRSSIVSSDMLPERLQTPTNLETKIDPLGSFSGQIFDDSCFKTPSGIPESPDSSQWMSSNAFLSTIASPHEEIFNKRESIAMILKNNTGHVLAKASLYDKHVRSSVANVEEAKRIVVRNAPKSAQKCFPSSSRPRYNENYISTKKCSSVKGRARGQRSPLPPPPKFVLTELNTPSPKGSRPLQELTNLSLEGEESKLGKSPNKYPKHDFCNQNPHKLALEPNLKIKVLKRNSFSGCTPYKLSKKVSRSESSPACHGKKTVLQE